MPNLAGKSAPVRRLSDTPGIPADVARAIRVLEDKAEELDARVRDLERRAQAGGI